MNEVAYHTHNGLDSPQVDPTDLLGYPVRTTAPTHTGKQGEIIMVDDGATVRRIYVYLNGTWRYTNLT